MARVSREEHWLKAYWRPFMAILYGLICLFDFLVFPGIAMALPPVYHLFGITYAYVPWVPITCTNGGMIHASFGAIVGLSAWTRGQEKIACINNTPTEDKRQ